MKKSNNKGFALAETLIVSTVVAGILIYLFIQFSTLKRNYNISFKYNTVDDLYAIEDLIDYVKSTKSSFKQNYIISTIQSNDYVQINKNDNGNYVDNVDYYDTVFGGNYGTTLLEALDIEQLIITYEDLSKVDISLFDDDINKFMNKIKYNSNNGYRMIAKFNNNTYASLIFKLEVDLDEAE